jgi:hypothetical protein
MPYQNDFTLSAALLEQFSSNGLEAVPTLFQVLRNASAEERTGHASGYKD